ncbi:MAG: response regulator [Deltaproteobacteria bacterium]|nr:response regulator [Deltaproteobacteria bacterium]
MARVLIIESDAAVATSLTQLLEAKGVQTKVTADGGEGVSLARSFKPDAIVLCVELSRVSGYSICNKLKKDPELGRIPLLLTSSQATVETFEQHKKLKTRAEAYLKKPYSNEEITNVLASYMRFNATEIHEVDVSLEELSVDIDDSADDAEIEIETEIPDGPTHASAPPPPAPPAQRASTSSASISAAASTSNDNVTLSGLAASSGNTGSFRARGSSSAVNNEAIEALRNENKQLRLKVQKMEETIEQKELEFNDRLLQESSRGREGIEAKKKLASIEREINKYKEQVEASQSQLDEAQRSLEDMKQACASAENEKEVLADKIGQLVDKVKSLAAEREELQQEIEKLNEARSHAEQEGENEAKLREKTRKAIDIAMQLLDEASQIN